MGLHVKWVLGGIFLITNTLATNLHYNNRILPRVRKSLDHRKVGPWDRTSSFLDTSVNLLCSITSFAWPQLGETLKRYPHDASYALMISSSSSLFLIFILLVPTMKHFRFLILLVPTKKHFGFLIFCLKLIYSYISDDKFRWS